VQRHKLHRDTPLTLRAYAVLKTQPDRPPLKPPGHLGTGAAGTSTGHTSISRSRAIGEGTFHRWWERSLEGAGVRYRNPHTARDTFATRWLRRGGRMDTLSKAMGHASIATTVDLYGHLDVADIARDLALVESGGGINPLHSEGL
jgi:integrase